MKNFNLTKITVLLVFCANYTLAQNIVQDGGFESFSCALNSCTPPTFDAASCSEDWVRSHGSPNYQTSSGNGANGSDSYMYTFYQHSIDEGEGIYCELNRPMYYGDTYLITVWARYNISSSNYLGRVRASSSLTEYTGCDYSSAKPTSSSEYINDVPLNSTTNTWKRILNDFSYSPSADYDQLWLFPEATTSTSPQLTVHWDDIRVCPEILHLSSSSRLNESVDFRAGDYIVIGDGASATTLSAALPNHISMIAKNEVIIKPETEIDATLVSSLWINIADDPCGLGVARPANDDVIASSGNSDIQMEKAMKVYPNPNQTGIFNIESSLFGQGTKTAIQVVDVYGRMVKSIDANSSREIIDLSDMSKGVYYLRVSQGDQRYTEKIIYN